MTYFQTEIEQRKAAEQVRDRALKDIKLGLLTLQFHRWDEVETGPEFARIWREVQELAEGARKRA